MNFATFQHDGREKVGIVVKQSDLVYPLEVATMLDLIERYDVIAPQLNSPNEPIELRSTRLLAPIPRPARNIFCVGKNYRDHAKEFARSGFEAGAVKDIDEHPAVFSKPASCVIGPDDFIESHPTVTDSLDYEAELAVVIGKAGRNIRKADAMSFVWGYTIINDVTARDRQKNHRQWLLGKALDTFCPMGPWITSASGIDETDLQVKTWINGELRQNASTGDLVFDIPTLIETISAGLTLQPGDIIATGTPAGVGIGFNPPRFLKPGDSIKISISGIGTLENQVN